MNRPDPVPAIGPRLKELRKEKKLSLAELARATDLSEATLSRVENEQTLVSAHHLYILAKALDVDITAFFGTGTRPLSNGIRSISREGETSAIVTSRYVTEVLCTDIANKLMHPAVNTVRVTSLDDIGGLSQHSGEEFLHVLEGTLRFMSEFYEPLILNPGDSLYFDSNMGHAYLSANGKPVKFLAITTVERPS